MRGHPLSTFNDSACRVIHIATSGSASHSPFASANSSFTAALAAGDVPAAMAVRHMFRSASSASSVATAASPSADAASYPRDKAASLASSPASRPDRNNGLFAASRSACAKRDRMRVALTDASEEPPEDWASAHTTSQDNTDTIRAPVT